MASAVDFGIPGIQALPGDHVCAFYRGRAERDDALLPFLRAGLAAGEKCICVVGSSDTAAVARELRGELAAARAHAERQLDLLPSEEVYLRTGAFEADRMLDFWNNAVSVALGPDGFSFVRSVGDTTWALGDAPGVDGLIAYESRLNRFLPLYPQIILCLYDLGRITGEMVLDVVKTHPRVLVQGVLLENPYYLEPDELLAAHS